MGYIIYIWYILPNRYVKKLLYIEKKTSKLKIHQMKNFQKYNKKLVKIAVLKEILYRQFFHKMTEQVDKNRESPE